jgi:hypothetical protein
MNPLREAAQQALEALAEPDHFRDATEKVEPAAWFYEERGRQWVTDDLLEAQHSNDGVMTPLYTAPQPRKRLDDKQLEVVIYEHTKLNPNQADDRELIGYIINAIRAIEAAVWGETK